MFSRVFMSVDSSDALFRPAVGVQPDAIHLVLYTITSALAVLAVLCDGYDMLPSHETA